MKEKRGYLGRDSYNNPVLNRSRTVPKQLKRKEEKDVDLSCINEPRFLV